MRNIIALFGEAEKGRFDVAHFCHSLTDLYDQLGEGTTSLAGISLAAQALMYQYDVLFFRIKEEGFHIDSYFFGLHFLNTQTHLKQLAAIILPGVGDQYIIEASRLLCQKHHSLLLFLDQDLYDLLTYRPSNL